MSSIGINGAITLFFSNMLGKFFGAIYRIPLSNLLGAEGVGLYQMAFPIYSFLLTMLTGGISVTLSRKIACLRAKGDYLGVRKNYELAKKTSLFIGVLLFFFLLIFAYPLSIIQGNINAIYGYLGISIGFVFACTLGAYRGYYQGFGNMVPTAISQIIEQVSKLFLGLLFASIFIKFGINMAVLGATIGISASEAISFLYFKILAKKQKRSKLSIAKKDYLKFFKEVYPVSVSYGLLPLSALIDSFIIINLLDLSGLVTSYSTSLYGVYTGMILPLINMPNVLVSALAIALIPTLSYKLSKGESTKDSISKIFKIAYMFILPCAIGLFLLADKIIFLIYPTLDLNLFNVATTLLKFSCLEMFFLCFVTISNSILQSMGETKKPIYSMGVGLIVKLIFTIALVLNPTLNIYGLSIASGIGYFISATLNVLSIKRRSGFNLRFLEILTPILGCLFMTIILLVYLSLANGKLIGILSIVFICVIVYFTTLWFFKQFTFKEIKNMLQKGVK